MTNRPLRWRRYTQFRLRTLLLVVLLLSVACSCLGMMLQSAKRQRQAVEAIEAVGGAVSYDWEGESPRPPGPAFVRALLGDDVFSSVVWVRLCETPSGDDIMAHLEVLTELEILDLSHSRVTDSGLNYIKRLTKLQHVHLKGTAIGDAGVAHLRALVRLEWLELDGTDVGDAGLRHLENLGSLRELTLYDTRVTKEGIQRLRSALPSARILSSWDTRRAGG